MISVKESLSKGMGYEFKAEENVYYSGWTKDGEAMNDVVAFCYVCGKPAKIELSHEQREHIAGFLLDKNRRAIYADAELGIDSEREIDARV